MQDRPAASESRKARSAEKAELEKLRALLAEKGVLLVPGSVMDREGYLRIGYANTPEVIAAGLDKMGEYLAELPL